jgi:hypothetical protein
VIGNQLDIQVKDTVLDPNAPPDTARKVHVRRQDQDTYYYKVWIYLEGNDLPYVDYVTFTLDETFAERYRTVTRSPSNPNCQLVIWTWGLFTVNAVINDKRGNQYEVEHRLTYDKDLSQDPNMYIYEEEEALASRPRLITAR